MPVFTGSARSPVCVFRSFLIASVCLAACLFALAAAQAFADEPGPALIWQAGDTRVFALEDRPGGMDEGLFSGPATPEERARYFKDGKAEGSINVFLIQKNGQNLLVDTGFGKAAPGKSRLLPLLAAMGISPEQVDRVLLTHMHTDHVGGLVDGATRVFAKATVLVAKAEADSWLQAAKAEPDNANAALVNAVAQAYGGDLETFALGGEVLPGLIGLDASGHTPGHTVFQLEDGGRTLLILGDLLLAAALQFALPEECARYDMDMPKAVASRKAILDLAAEKQWPVAGTHIPFTGIGLVAKDGKGYRFTPTGSVQQ